MEAEGQHAATDNNNTSAAPNTNSLEEKRLELDWARLRADRQKSAGELRLKRKELGKIPSNRYLDVLMNPFTLAILGGFITLMTTIISNHYSTSNNLATERAKAEYSANVEEVRATIAADAANHSFQADLIKKFVESSQKVIVRENLRFLVDAGLLPDYAKKITAYLNANPDAAPLVGDSGRADKPVEYVGQAFTVPEFRAYVAQIPFSSWKPEMIVLHSTQSPTLELWKTWSPEKQETYFANLSPYFGRLGRRGGPHLFIDTDKIWVFNPLDKPGTHSPSWNSISIGVEMIGDYELRPLNHEVRENTVQAIAILDAALHINADTLRFHSEDPKGDNPECPGRNVEKADFVGRIQTVLASFSRR